MERHYLLNAPQGRLIGGWLRVFLQWAQITQREFYSGCEINILWSFQIHPTHAVKPYLVPSPWLGNREKSTFATELHPLPLHLFPSTLSGFCAYFYSSASPTVVVILLSLLTWGSQVILSNTSLHHPNSLTLLCHAIFGFYLHENTSRVYFVFELVHVLYCCMAPQLPVSSLKTFLFFLCLSFQPWLVQHRTYIRILQYVL